MEVLQLLSIIQILLEDHLGCQYFCQILVWLRLLDTKLLNCSADNIMALWSHGSHWTVRLTQMERCYLSFLQCSRISLRQTFDFSFTIYRLKLVWHNIINNIIVQQSIEKSLVYREATVEQIEWLVSSISNAILPDSANTVFGMWLINMLVN